MDSELRIQLLRALVKDRAFLKASSKDVDPNSFPSPEEQAIAKAAINFYEQYEEPVGSLLRSEAEETGREAKLGINGRKKLKDIIDTIQGAKLELVPVSALQKRIRKLKESNFYTSAMEEIVTAYEKNKLDSTVLADIVEKAQKHLSDSDIVSRDYGSQLNRRIRRRRRFKEGHYPTLGIDPLDLKIRAVPRGGLAMFVASYSSGKGLALIHLAVNYAMQGLNVLHISLEDPREEVEDRLDSALTGLPKNRLHKLVPKLRRRFREARKLLRGRIHLIDGTDQEYSVSKVARAYEKERLDGFDADVIIVDYDDEIMSETQYKGESARRFEFADIYRRLRRLAAKLNVIIWTASQGNKQAEGTKVITGKHAAEDISKIRKCFLALGIGDTKLEQRKFIFVIRHKIDRSRFGVEICTKFQHSIFYDRKATLELMTKRRNGNG